MDDAKEEEARKERELRMMYRKVFSTPEGKKVFFSILSDLGFLAASQGEDRTALRNYAIFLIRERIGLNDANGFMDLISTILASAK